MGKGLTEDQGLGRRQGRGARGNHPYQGFLQPLLVEAVELISLSSGIDCMVQGLTEIHEAGLVLSQLVPNACGQ